LVRSCLALRDICLAYEIPLLSGKDSMYVDGHLTGRYGESHKLSALETLQFSTIGVVEDIEKCVSMDSKVPGDLVYVLGLTRNELGGGEYYEHLGYTGLNVPEVHPDQFLPLYHALSGAIGDEAVASAHGIYRGGLGVHIALVAMAGNLGMDVDLGPVPVEESLRDDIILFSESAGRFLVTVDPEKKDVFEQRFKGQPCACIGKVIPEKEVRIKGNDGEVIFTKAVPELKDAWKKPFGDLI